MRRALPTYHTSTNFDNCPPGHRFGPYFNGWDADWHKPTNKTPAFKEVASAFPQHSRDALNALRQRQQAATTALGDNVLVHPARLTAPLATGLGNEHPLENGFAFLNPHGLPYLAGSGVKGVLRRAAEELEKGEWGDRGGWNQVAIDILFGLETAAGDSESTRTRGALVFWDLFFQPPKGKGALAVEIMTPHHSGYLQNSGTPHANEQPNPIPFLAVPAGSDCTLFVQCNPGQIPDDAAALRQGWRTLMEVAIDHAGEWLGFGAKTAVGYGRVGIDPAAAAARDAQRGAEHRQQKAEEQARLIAALPLDEQILARIDARLATLPTDPRNGQAIAQPTSGPHWQPLLDLLTTEVDAVATLPTHARETLASEIRKRLATRFKIEGKADKAMKQRLAALRGS